MATSLNFKLILISYFLFLSILGQSQTCKASYTIILKNNDGGYYKDQEVFLTEINSGNVYQVISNSIGEAKFTLPCGTTYKLSVSNYDQTSDITMPKSNGGMGRRTLMYAHDLMQKSKFFAMTKQEEKTLENVVSELPDTIILKGLSMVKPNNSDYFILVSLNLKNLEEDPLYNEKVWLTGIKRNKTIQAITGTNGTLSLYLPKGDEYTLNFEYNKNYSSFDLPYSKGSSEITISYSYIGSKEILKRKKIEEERIATEEKRLKEEQERFVAYCRKLGITPEEGRKREFEGYTNSLQNFLDTVVISVLNRNNWENKLIVCDLTGSMQPYASQLTLWYNLHYKKEKNLQFVFFNDGDQKPDNQKKIGETGGIYYSKSYGMDSLFNFAAIVSSRGNGGDCAENNMEALIKGVKMAEQFKELVMIVDNNAPVKDIELLKKFNTPVHIILCGLNEQLMLDYLLIAWKTKGSIHTIESDITKIASMMEGEEIIIKGIKYKIMGGEFVRITKI